ncbi:DUF397 domain-containing protein [Streptomyces olivaceus]|uniref:DUF397 domain-containing protein n=1 Tax=Streptomyces olivaceus TaxID=47716 RepID=UPI0033B97868
MNKMQSVPFPPATDWFKSSYSAANNECIEIAHALRQVGIRDSKLSSRSGFTISDHAFAQFVAGLKETPDAPSR